MTADGMQEGVRGSAVFLLFLSKGYFSRPFWPPRARAAREAKKRLILVHETDGRHDAFQFPSWNIERVPEDCRQLALALLVEAKDAADQENATVGLPEEARKRVLEFTKANEELLGVPEEWHAYVREVLEKNRSEKYQVEDKYAKAMFDDLEERIRGVSSRRDALDLAPDVASACLATAELKAKDFMEGTRGWMFDALKEWGTQQETSWTRAFVVLGVAGIGKSVFAAPFAGGEGSSTGAAS